MINNTQITNTSSHSSLVVKLIADIKPNTIPPTLSSHKLLIPMFFFDYSTESWLILPNDKFSLNGSECNKIGVSFNAFRNQPNRCNSEVGECLKYQPE